MADEKPIPFRDGIKKTYEEIKEEIGCDAETPTVYMVEGQFACRCMICPRCNHHTGNSHQGHYWAFCKVTGKMEEFHFCCPDDCELQGGKDGRTGEASTVYPEAE